MLISAGLLALDELVGEGIDLGQVVSFGRYTGDEKLVERNVGTSGRTVLICKSRDITSSADLRKEIKDGKKKVERDSDPESETYGDHFINDVEVA